MRRARVVAQARLHRAFAEETAEPKCLYWTVPPPAGARRCGPADVVRPPGVAPAGPVRVLDDQRHLAVLGDRANSRATASNLRVRSGAASPRGGASGSSLRCARIASTIGAHANRRAADGREPPACRTPAGGEAGPADPGLAGRRHEPPPDRHRPAPVGADGSASPPTNGAGTGPTAWAGRRRVWVRSRTTPVGGCPSGAPTPAGTGPCTRCGCPRPGRRPAGRTAGRTGSAAWTSP